MGKKVGVITINIETFIKLFLERFPEYLPVMKEHINYNQELLPHVFFGDEVNDDLINLFETEKNEEKKKLFDLFEFMLINGDVEVQEVITLTILARLGDEPKILKKAIKYMGKETKKASDEIEYFWGRNFEKE